MWYKDYKHSGCFFPDTSRQSLPGELESNQLKTKLMWKKKSVTFCMKQNVLSIFIFSLGLFFKALFEGIILGQPLIAYTHTHTHWVQSWDFYPHTALWNLGCAQLSLNGPDFLWRAWEQDYTVLLSTYPSFYLYILLFSIWSLFFWSPPFALTPHSLYSWFSNKQWVIGINKVNDKPEKNEMRERETERNNT